MSKDYRFERAYKFSAWVPGFTADPKNVEVKPTDDHGVRLLIDYHNIVVDEEVAIALHLALSAWMERRDATDNPKEPA